MYVTREISSLNGGRITRGIDCFVGLRTEERLGGSKDAEISNDLLPDVLEVQKRRGALFQRGDRLLGISGRSSQCGIREEPTERRQGARQVAAFLQLRHL